MVYIKTGYLVAWLIGNALISINKVALS